MGKERERPTQSSLGEHLHTIVENGECNSLLIGFSECDVVDRGVKAVTIIYQLTNRVSTLIEQSHLERNEGS